MAANPIIADHPPILDNIFREAPADLSSRTVSIWRVTEFGKIEGGCVNCVSNGDRADMIAMLGEYLACLEGRVGASGGPQ